jgi:hypothetical protein
MDYTMRNNPQKDIIVVTFDELERVRQCLSNPQPPTPAAVRAAEMLRQLPTPSR